MGNIAFVLIVVAGGIVAGSAEAWWLREVGGTYNPLVILVPAIIIGAIARAAISGKMPRQVWGPGTIPPRDSRLTPGRDSEAS